MEVDPSSPIGPQPYTILRIKRKRNEEPLDALVVESTVRRKKRGGLDVFQFAETVEPEAWGDRSKDLQDRISVLEREQASKTGTQPVLDDSPPPSRRPDLSRQYTVVLEDSSPTPNPASPPSVVEEDKGQLDYKLYDAVLSSDATSPVDSEMEKFLPLLQEYLTIHDLKPSTSRTSDSLGTLTPSGSRPSASVAVAAPAPIPPSDDPDFVWDVFYHRAGLTNEYDGAAKIATLTGLPDSLADPYASASESEEEDEADEDSNAEEYYKNDYPDEESSEGDTSGGSDLFLDDPDNYDNHDWR